MIKYIVAGILTILGCAFMIFSNINLFIVSGYIIIITSYFMAFIIEMRRMEGLEEEIRDGRS